MELIGRAWLFSFSFPFPFFFFNTLLSLLGNSGRLTWVRLQQLQEQCYPVLQIHAGSFPFSVMHQILLTWTTGSFTDVRMSSLCVRIHTGVGHTPTTSRHNFFRSEKLTNFYCAPDGVRISGLWISSPTIYQLSHPTPHHPSLTARVLAS